MRSGVNDPRLVDRVGGLADVIDDPFVSMVAMAVTYRAGYFSVPKPWNDYFLSITSNVSYNESKVLIGPVQQEPANQFCARVAEEQNLARFGNFSPQQRLMKLLVSPNLVPDSASLQEAVTAVPGTRGVDYLRRLVEGIWNMRRLLAVAQETAEGLLAQAGYPPPVAEDRAPGED
jgi:hypothetical protein